MNVRDPSFPAPSRHDRKIELQRGGVLSLDARAGLSDIVSVEAGMLAFSTLLADGRRLILSLATEGEALSSACCAGCRIEALSEATIVLRQIDESADELASIFADAHRRLIASSERQTLLGRFTAAERAAAFLVELAERLGQAAPDGAVEAPLPLSRDDIADYLGLKSETMSRMFTRFRKNGLIEFPTRDRCRILDLGALKAILPAVEPRN
ncbi:MAG: helix-turn-helix domain-containing protein [Pseudomonadota bacterium]